MQHSTGLLTNMKDFRSKGLSFERLIAKRLSLWITEGKDEYAIERRVASGAAIADKKGLTSASGDLIGVKPSSALFMKSYCFELKCYTDLKPAFYHFMMKREGLIDKFVKQAVKAANEASKAFMVIAKTNRGGCFALSNCILIREVCRLHKSVSFAELHYDRYLINFFNFDEFLDKASSKLLLTRLHENYGDADNG